MIYISRMTHERTHRRHLERSHLWSWHHKQTICVFTKYYYFYYKFKMRNKELCRWDKQCWSVIGYWELLWSVIGHWEHCYSLIGHWELLWSVVIGLWENRVERVHLSQALHNGGEWSCYLKSYKQQLRCELESHIECRTVANACSEGY